MSSSIISSLIIASASATAKAFAVGGIGYWAARRSKLSPDLPNVAMTSISKINFNLLVLVIPLMYSTIAPPSLGTFWFILVPALVVISSSYKKVKAAEQRQVACETTLVRSVEELKICNENLERKVAQLVDEKSQLELDLMHEMHKAEKRKSVSTEKRIKFKSKLGDMKARLKDDRAAGGPNPAAEKRGNLIG